MKIQLLKNDPELKAVQVGLDSETGILLLFVFRRFSSLLIYIIEQNRN